MAHQSVRQRFKNLSKDQSGSTLVETVMSIPIVFLIFGMVLATTAVAIGLMSQVSSGAGAARVASQAMDDLSKAQNCVEVNALTADYDNPEDSDYSTTFSSYSCLPGESFPLTLEVKKKDGSKVLYSKTVTMAVKS